MGDRLCRVCATLTYPDAWCQCDPRWQVEAHLRDECEPLEPPESLEELAA